MGYACSNGSLDCAVFDRIVGRLTTGKSRQEAQSEIAARISWSATDAVGKRPRVIHVLAATGVGPDGASVFRSQMQLLMATAGTLLLIACANLAGLFLARGVTRRKEIAVRLSIGASSYRIVRQLMTESLLLAIAGTAVGLLLSYWGRDFLGSVYSANSEGFGPRYDLGLDGRVLLYSITLAGFCAVLFGLAPALTACRLDLLTTLKESVGPVGAQRRGWMRHALVCAQVALSLVLLVSAGLLVRSSHVVV